MFSPGALQPTCEDEEGPTAPDSSVQRGGTAAAYLLNQGAAQAADTVGGKAGGR